MIETVTDTVLTKDDIDALRVADRVTFHHGPENTRYVATCIRAHTENRYESPVIWSAREQRLFPKVDSGSDRAREIMPERSSMCMYGSGLTTNAVAFHYLSSSATNAAWQTIVGLMRAGDALRVSWRADNNNKNHESVGFHNDELRLTVVRSEKVKMTFLVATQVGPHNTARMIRPDGL